MRIISKLWFPLPSLIITTKNVSLRIVCTHCGSLYFGIVSWFTRFTPLHSTTAISVCFIVQIVGHKNRFTIYTIQRTRPNKSPNYNVRCVQCSFDNSTYCGICCVHTTDRHIGIDIVHITQWIHFTDTVPCLYLVNDCHSVH